ncbi:MAG: GNAT family N-acetyltransferase [Candidatus Eisenbacteria bacterium]
MSKASKERLVVADEIPAVSRPSALPRGWSWHTPRTEVETSRWEAAWEALVVRNRLGFLASPAWVRPFLRSFVGEQSSMELHVLADGDRCLAVLPLHLRVGLVRAVDSFENEHWPYWTCAIDTSSPQVAEAVLSHVLELGDEVDFHALHETGPVCAALVAAADRLRLPHHSVRSAKGDTSLALPRTWDSCLRALSRHLQRDLRQGARKLAEAGEVRLEVECGGERLESTLRECFELEARGWKGESGSPIQSGAATLRFYRELAESAARRGALAIYQLRLDSRLIAFEYCLRYQDRIELLKISYDPEWARVSPGTVLRGMILEREVALGEVRSYHFGRPSEWKLRWTDQVLPLTELRVFAPGWRGQLASLGNRHLASMMRRLSAVRAASRWMRSLVHSLPF